MKNTISTLSLLLIMMKIGYSSNLWLSANKSNYNCYKTNNYFDSVPKRITPQPVKGDEEEKIDKRGDFMFSTEYKTKDPYLGSYDTTGGGYFNQQYLSLQVKYKIWFGLYFSLTPEFYFNKNAAQFVGNYFGIGYEKELLDGFNIDVSYSYNAKSSNGGRRLKSLYNNDAKIELSYENDYITPILKYDFTFGKVNGAKRNELVPLGYETFSVFGYDNVVNIGIKHDFDILEENKNGDLTITLENNYNFGTANTLLTTRQQVVNPNYNPSKPKQGKKSIFIEFPVTNDKFSALNTEVKASIDYSWHFIEIIPEIDFSIPFRDLGQAQKDASAFTVKGRTFYASSIVSKPLLYGGITIAFNWPFDVYK